MRYSASHNDWLAPQAVLPVLRNDAMRGGDSATPTSVSGVLARSGSPLDAAVRSEAEARTGRDFSGVRVHTDDLAARSARDLGALGPVSSNAVRVHDMRVRTA